MNRSAVELWQSAATVLLVLCNAFLPTLGHCQAGRCKTRQMLEAGVRTRLNNSEDMSDLLHNAQGAAKRSGPGAKPGKLLDIVIAHHSEWNEWQVRPFWEDFLNTPKMQQLKPYVYFYCQNPNIKEDRLREMFGTVIERGEIVSLENMGREGRVYLHHIVHNYDRLAKHTLFSQDIAGEKWQPVAPTLPRMQANEKVALLGAKLLPSRPVPPRHWHTCFVGSLCGSVRGNYLTYAMVVGKYCPRDGFAGILKGQFIASDKRITSRSKVLYMEMLQLIEADQEHPIHRRHNTDWFKNQENPYIGHVYERAWSLLFDCHASQNASAWVDQCRECEANQYIDCPPGACQCLDEAVPASKPRTTTISIHMQNATKNGTTKY